MLVNLRWYKRFLPTSLSLTVSHVLLNSLLFCPRVPPDGFWYYDLY